MRRRELLTISTVLLGAGVGERLTRAVLAGVEVSSGAASSKFAESQRLAVEILCDMIIPTTDTPGAVEAGVSDFVATIVFDWYTESERTAFFDGLQALDEHCLAKEHVPPWQIPFRGKRLRDLYQQDYFVQSQNYAFNETTRHFFSTMIQKTPMSTTPRSSSGFAPMWLAANLFFGGDRSIAGATSTSRPTRRTVTESTDQFVTRT